MIQSSKVFLTLLSAGLVLTACTVGPILSGKDTPAGGTRTEFAFQTAAQHADQGYCATAMPIFVCLGSQGSGWEVAAERAGKCAPLAAKLWQQPKVSAGSIVSSDPRPRRRSKWVELKQPFAYQYSRQGILNEGLRQLRRAANANWPEAQAELTIQLEQTANNLPEARHWMERYYANARRKIYGGNAIPLDVQKRLKLVPRTGEGSVMWSPTAFASEDLKNLDCDRLLGKSRITKPAPIKNDTDDDLKKTKPKHASEPVNPDQQTTGNRRQRPGYRP